jgi:hypothetical protein
MQYDMRLTAESIRALGAWVYHGNDAADVELAVDDRMLVAEQGDERMAWDTDGSPASEEYLAVAPLDPTGEERLQYVFVVAPAGDYEPAVFADEQRAEEYASTFDADAFAMVTKLLVCRGEVARKMIAERDDEEAEADREARPYVVGEVSDPGVIERFATADEASQYIADTFPASDVESGRYYIDGPEES